MIKFVFAILPSYRDRALPLHHIGSLRGNLAKNVQHLA